MRQQQHPVADGLDFYHVMRGPEDAAVIVGGERPDLGTDELRRGRVQRGGGLVEQQQLRPVEQRLGERRARLLARGQQAALGAAQFLQIKFADELIDAGAQPRDAVEQAEEGEILLDGEIARQGGIHRREIGALERLCAAPGNVDAADEYPARGGLKDAEYHVDGGGFARAVRSDEAHDLAAPDLKRHVVDRGDFVILFAQLLHGERV